MKKSILIIAISMLIISCKNGNKNEENKNATLINGEFILVNDAGVIKGDDFIYGVVLNDLAHELNEKIKPLQREEFDMVPVVINGVIKKNTEEGWPEVVEIIEIVSVAQPTSELPAKINTSEQKTTVPITEGEEESHEGHNH